MKINELEETKALLNQEKELLHFKIWYKAHSIYALIAIVSILVSCILNFINSMTEAALINQLKFRVATLESALSDKQK